VERFTVGILALVAQRERELISDRTKSALEAARKRDVRLGTKNPNRQVKLMVAGYRRQKIAFVSKIRQVCTRRANENLRLFETRRILPFAFLNLKQFISPSGSPQNRLGQVGFPRRLAPHHMNPSSLTRRRSSIGMLASVVILAIAVFASTVHGQSIIASNPYVGPESNGPPPSVYSYAFQRMPGPGGWSAQGLMASFSTGNSNWILNDVSLNLSLVSGVSTDASVSIWAGNSNSATDMIASLITPSITVQSDYVFTPSSPVALAADSTYWIVAQPSMSTYSSFFWYLGEDSGKIGILPYYNDSNQWGGLSGNNDTFSHGFAFTVTGTSAVPEPSTYAAIMGLSSVGFVMIRRRFVRKQAD
jgi:hypothetical protein